MARDKYVSMRKSISGFSFANLGLFTGLADGIYNAVYSLVILSIFNSSAIVGIYSGIYASFCMIAGLFANEILRMFTKVRVFYFSILMLAACYAMMAFSIMPRTFIVLDFASGIAITLTQVLIPLFMSDFAGRIGMARLNSRYHLWTNIGALVAPTIAMWIAGIYGNRAAFMGAGLVYLAGWAFFKYFRIVQQDKKIRPINPRRTFRALWRNARAFYAKSGMLRAYAVNFGFYSLRAMRYLYVPIAVIENGFTKTALGWVLTLGIIPYLILTEPMARLVRQYGKRVWLFSGFASFAILSVFATFTHGVALLAIFVLWQISGALMESVHDLMFFDNTKKSEQSRFYGVFRTSVNLPNIVAPVLAAGCIWAFGTTSSVWVVTATIGAISAILSIKE